MSLDSAWGINIDGGRLLHGLSIDSKVLVAPIAVMVLFIAITVASILALKNQGNTLTEIVGGGFDAAMTTSRLAHSVSGIHADVLRYVELSRLGQEEASVVTLRDSFGPRFAEAEQMLLSLEANSYSLDVDLLQNVSRVLADYRSVATRLTGTKVPTPQVVSPFMVDYQKLDTQLNDLGIATIRSAKEKQQRTESYVAHTVNLLIMSAIASLLIAGILTWLIGRAISLPLTRITGVMSKLANGNHDIQIPGTDWTDEVGSIARAVEVFRQVSMRLHQRESELAQAVEQLNSRNSELTETLEQQNATSEILRTITGALTDTQPVFEAIVKAVIRLYEGDLVSFLMLNGDRIHLRALEGKDPDAAKRIEQDYPMLLNRASLAGRAILDRCAVHVPDINSAQDFPLTLSVAKKLNCRSFLAVPLLREGIAVGAIAILGYEPKEYSAKQIALLNTFADQAVIAIENMRSFQEIAAKSEQVAAANRHKSEFLASMSHELRTPLNAILGFNEMILGQIYGEVPADMQAPLAQIQTSGKHLLRLINNVLDLAKIEAGRMELTLSDYFVHETVESVRSTLGPLAVQKGLELIASVPNDIPLAYGDAGRITQCLMNLAGNSLKFTKAGKVEISVKLKDSTLVCRVADTGIGISPDKIGSLFSEFKQTDATIARDYGGTGLGLSISKKFIEMHGGRIWVESELGTGSVFIFEIPLRSGVGAQT